MAAFRKSQRWRRLVKLVRMVVRVPVPAMLAILLVSGGMAIWHTRSAHDAGESHFSAEPVGPFEALLLRVFPRESAERVHVSYQGKSGEAFFTLQVSENTLLIEASDVLSACSAVHHFCLHHAACTLSWGQHSQPRLPRRLPALVTTPGNAARMDDIGALQEVGAGGVVTKHRVMRHAYYLNFCTPTYTMAFWDWPQWERELDWMALHSIDMPLIITGREVVMRRLFREQGLTDKQIMSFFTGPAFLAWHRMGNLKSFAGPMPESYLKHSELLTRKVLARARALGMTPVLPGFSGHVPDELAKIHPKEHFSKLKRWSGFPAAYSGLLFVEPSSDLYLQLGKRYIEIQTELFGTDHFYAVDQFNENDPRSNNPEYLSKCGKTQFDSLRAADPKAVWVMQGWLFVFAQSFWGAEQIDAYLRPVPKDGMLVLDLSSETSPAYKLTQSYHGKPFIWSVLHNFGGQVGLRGNLLTIMKRPYEGFTMPGSTMVGIGLTMEAINQNPVMYELTLDHVWNDKSRDMEPWLRNWVRARYGYRLGRSTEDEDVELAGPAVQQAWGLLLRSCYSVMDRAQGNGFWGVTKSVIEKRPSLNTRRVVADGFQESVLRYKACDLVEAWRLFVDAARGIPDTAQLRGTAFELDLLDIGRQVLSNHAHALYMRFAKIAGNDGPRDETTSIDGPKDRFLRLLADLDDLLETSEHFSLSAWLRGAQALAVAGDDAELALYRFNAHNLLTLWGPNGQVADYSARLWGGLIRRYYLPRWRLAMDAVSLAIRSKKKVDDGLFAGQVRQFEERWQREPDAEYLARRLSDTTRGDTTLASIAAFNKYHDEAKTACMDLS
mmetsp:Transcript_7793/g.19248  ORF Transcript_7793/g.19248 Transcript_7793/m.19248 type:complete len:835 (-) Transcript_7793:157-2661(-)